MGRLGRLPEAEDERLSSLAGREEAMLVPVPAKGHNNYYMECLTSPEVARRADQRSVMMPSTLGELREEAEATSWQSCGWLGGQHVKKR